MDGHRRIIARTPEPPYYAVIFTSLRTDGDHGYGVMAAEMDALAGRQPGYLGIESAREQIGITVSYWTSLEDIAHWRRDLEHLVAQRRGRDEWYQAYSVRIARVERAYEFERA